MWKGFVIMALLSFFSVNSQAKLKVGDAAPSLTAKNQEGQDISLDYNAGYTMVYFYPKADTPGCTAQACSLRDAYEVLEQKGVKIYGVSTDKPAAQKKFKEKYRLPFTLIADTDKKVAKAFGVPVRMGFTSRQAFLIKDKKVVWLDRSASTKKQAEDILAFITKEK